MSVPYALHAGSVHLDVSVTGDTLFVGDGSFVIIPGISQANSFTTGTTLHICGAPNVHNPDLTYGTMTDQEGNVYKTIAIGTQVWMAENLNTSIYRNGDAIGTVNPGLWASASSGAWEYLYFQSSLACPYGRLYNWFACDDSRGLCPVGWHIPNFIEWVTLTDYLGGEFSAGVKLKAIGTFEQGNGLWEGPNLNATNSSGFSAVPGGVRELCCDGFFRGDGVSSYWWGSSDDGANNAFHIHLDTSTSLVYTQYDLKQYGFSVRCLRD